MSLATRVVTFGSTTVQIESTDGRSAEIVDFLFKRMSCEAVGPASQNSLRLSQDPAGGMFRLSSHGAVWCADRAAGTVASWLLHLTCRQLAGGGTTGLLLHAGAVSWGGRSLLLPGPSGAGKSTLTAFLTDRGFEYLTDELVHVPTAAISVEGLTMPLKVKQSGFEALEGYVRLPTRSAAIMETSDGILVELDGSRRAPAAVPLSAIVFPRYQPGGHFRLRALRPALTSVRLIAGVLNADTLPDHGFREAARIARVTPAYEMRYGHLGQVDDQLELLRRIASA